MCHKWKLSGQASDILADEIAGLLSMPEFSGVTDVQFSGGELTQRNDIIEFITACVSALPSLKKVLLATNGTDRETIYNIFKSVQKIKEDLELKICISLDGDRDTCKEIRGMDCHDQAVDTIGYLSDKLPEVKRLVLMTISAKNANREAMDYVRNVARETGSNFSFRTAYDNEHHKCDVERIGITDEQKDFIMEYSVKYCGEDPFISAQVVYLRTGKMEFTRNCQAGNLFANIRADGGIYPCMNSTRKIGDHKTGVTGAGYTLGEYESCASCCDEACFYPMYNSMEKKK